MRLPGFTAEESVGWRCASYKMASAPAGRVLGGVVQPQFFFCHGDYCCDEWGYCIYKGHVLM